MGAGTSIPSIILNKYCNSNQIIITDDFKVNKKLLTLIENTLKLNEIQPNSNIKIEHLSWSSFNRDFMNKLPKINYLFGSDVFFDTKLYEGIKS